MRYSWLDLVLVVVSFFLLIPLAMRLVESVVDAFSP
jgi:hypothetical protein